MFEQNAVDAWQSITPSDGLKQRVLAQKAPEKPEKIVRFPSRLTKKLTVLAAACAAAVLIFTAQPVPQLIPGPITASVAETYSMARTAALEEPEPVVLTPDGKCRITVDSGSLLSEEGPVDTIVTDGTVVWQPEGEGPHHITLRRGVRSACYELTRDACGVWQIAPAE